MTTRDTRKIRSYDFGPAHASAETRENEDGPMVRDRLALPYNDNARESAAEAASRRGPGQPSPLVRDDEPDADAPDALQAGAPVADVPSRARRRGPLVTRWIGHAALRRQAQARVNRMRQRQT